MQTPTDSSRRRLLGVALGVAATPLMVRWDGTALKKKAGVAAQGSQSFADAELKYASQRADLCGGGNAVGGGLRAEYFSEEGMIGRPLLVRVDRTVDFDAAFDWPAGQSGAPHSVRWSGWIKPPLTGRYKFHADAPGMTVSVARSKVAGHQAPPDAGIEMVVGRFYPIIVELAAIDHGFSGRWRLEWTAPHGMRYVVPSALMFVPT